MSAQFVISNNQKCNELLNDNQVRFVGIINKLGNLISGGFKEGTIPFASQEKLRMMYMQMVLEISMRSDFDSSLGPVNYIASNRGKVMMISVPLDNHLLLISASPTASAERIVTKAMSIFGKIPRKTKDV